MSYLLFLDESGHDHRNCPYEVHGGIAMHASKLWAFVQAVGSLEVECFGDRLQRFGAELKGEKVLEKNRFKWARQSDWMEDSERRRHALSFLHNGLNGRPPRRHEFTAYGQASLAMARGVFRLLAAHDAKILAAAIPRGLPKPPTDRQPDLLRKDIVFLLERYFYLLEDARETGMIVLDETDKEQDRRFVRMLERYFRETATGRSRAIHIVPTPMFVSSEMTTPVQVADLVIYAINWGFRLPFRGMDAEAREEIAQEFGASIRNLQYRGQRESQGISYDSFGIVYVPDLYQAR